MLTFAKKLRMSDHIWVPKRGWLKVIDVYNTVGNTLITAQHGRKRIKIRKRNTTLVETL